MSVGLHTRNVVKPAPASSHFDNCKIQVSKSRTKMKKGEESDFSAAVRETNERRSYELVSSTYYYWGSLLDNSNVDCLLTSEKQCILIDAPPTMLCGRERCRFAFVVKERDIKYHSIKCAANELIISGCAKKLGKFIAEEHLQPVQRQYIWREEQISPILNSPAATFDSLYQVGKVQRRKILFPDNKSIQVISIVVADLRPEERNVIINDLAKFKDFGCLNIQRLWGSMVTDTRITIFLEDTAVESLSDYVTADVRSNAEVVIFGLSTGLIPKRIYTEDVERWMPWECLTGSDGTKPDPYDQPAVIWTLATMIWSMFHRAAIPFENETVSEIRSRAYRKDATLDVMEELLPNGLLEVRENTKRDHLQHVGLGQDMGSGYDCLDYI
ncbi:unnamed protein product [Haemonchus placei]|uniref:Protein kinase domain-containing protein n=1 Tax=Haemonchus placei TaxID=6290 RepID=A0A0N4WB89_HAEPC|nr:unnamed protein product [Haemonchus placei]